jgi:NAD(P)-dependent dehydrogenase (short-subunit alcohol dehydrogenase family)
MSKKMQGKTVLVTGATDGIGKQTAIKLARMGAQVIVHGRRVQRCKDALVDISATSGRNDLRYIVADFSRLDEVRRMADEFRRDYDRLDVLINNAGVFMKRRVLTDENFEMSFCVNHLAPFMLTMRLLPLLRASTPARIVTVSSMAHQRGKIDFKNLQGEDTFRNMQIYSNTKLANVLFTFELAERLAGSGVTATCLHPGVIATKLLHVAFDLPGDDPSAGAETPVYLASSPEAAEANGLYFQNCAPSYHSPLADDVDLRREFWEISEYLSGEKFISE